MAQVIEIDELDAGECLATFGHLRATRDNAERDIVLLSAHFADLYNVDSRSGELVSLPGRERPVRLGGEGTPLVWEFAVAEVAAELSMSTWSARRLTADALDIRHRLPRLWRGLDSGTVLAGRARKVAQATRELSLSQAGMVDEQMVGYADGRLPFSRFISRLEGQVVAADPIAAAARERKAREEEFARVGQSNDHGQKTLYVRTGAAQMARIDATIAYYAEVLQALGDTDTVEKRRSKAVLLLANPTQAVALLQALAGPDSSAGGASGLPPDRPSTDGGAGPPPPPPPEWDDELDLDLPDDAVDEQGPDGERSDAERDEGKGSGRGSDSGRDEGNDASPDSPTGSAEAFLKPFFTPFRPTQVPPCPCRGGGFLLDAAAMLPEVTLYLHAHAESLAAGDGVVRWEGLGPVTGEYLRTVLGPHARFTVKPVVDPEGVPPADAYEIPSAMAEALHLRTPFDVFPFAVNTGRGKQKDHTVAYDFSEVLSSPDHGTHRDTRSDSRHDTGHDTGHNARRDARGRIRGQTGLHNLGGMTGFHHRVKTHGRWQVRQPFPGVYLWKSPHGSLFCVDGTGTQQLSGPVVNRRPVVSRSGPAGPDRTADGPATHSPADNGPTTNEPTPGDTHELGLTFRTDVTDAVHDESPSLAHFRQYLRSVA